METASVTCQGFRGGLPGSVRSGSFGLAVIPGRCSPSSSSWEVQTLVSRSFPRFRRSREGTVVRASLKPETEQRREDDAISERATDSQQPSPSSSSSPPLDKELEKAVRKTAATFAPRSSTARKNPATPGSTLYTVFEVQAYASMLVGGVLSFNLLFPSDQPDIWRLMGMWSVWMFTIPSLRARDCSKNEKEALNYLFLVVPLINVTLPIVWKSFAAVWTADVVAFFAMYAWKMQWIGGTSSADDSSSGQD